MKRMNMDRTPDLEEIMAYTEDSDDSIKDPNYEGRYYCFYNG